MTELIEIEVENDLDELPRLDQYLSAKLGSMEKHFSRSRVQKLIDEGAVTVDDKAAKASLRLNGGELIQIEIPELQELELKAQDIPINIVYEDDALIVINKNAGMVVHPGAGVHDGTLVNALLKHCEGKLAGINGTIRPGIVHRIDKDTSGLLVVAKTDNAHTSLSSQISSKEAKRVYLALLEGTPAQSSGLIDKAVGRHKTDRKKMAVSETGRSAQTHFEVLSQWPKFCLIKASLKTGRTHQIRVHMASINCPVVGDIVYNKKSTGTEAARKKLGLIGQALHATYLCFRHPDTGQLLEFEAKLPDDFQTLIDSL
ncbi:MAG: RluA family pseudouridine synthase [Candidatus Obscuribacterales bacterium]|nr:RluA family pseudouridine synthase [Candidatus Obscuribacterales bacterium]